MLVVALIPSIALLGAGVGVSSYLLIDALKQRQTADLLSSGYGIAVPFMPALSGERSASLAMVAHPSPQNQAALDQSRKGVDQVLPRARSVAAQVADAMPPDAKLSLDRFIATTARISAVRQQVDNGQTSRLQVYDAYNQVADAMILAADAIGRDATGRDAALLRSQASDLMWVSDWLDRSNALAVAAYSSGGMTPAEADQYNSLTRAYRAQLSVIEPRLPNAEQRKLDQLTASQDWIDAGRVEDALVGSTRSLPVSVQRWQDAVHHNVTTLSSVGLGDLGTSADALETQSAEDALLRASIVAAASLLLAIAVLIAAARLGNNLALRLRWLRANTIEADARLPHIMERIRGGERVNAEEEIPELDYGSDEVAEVTAAFGKAQRTAIVAAVQEAQLREGTKTAFVNIARRSQAVVQRQLELLEQAQRAAEDPDQVALLFQLDHLSTRERRNAENLIILGGGQLAWQWRTSVRLIDLVRGAVAETEHYKRVEFGRLPELFVAWHAVTDLVHLLAELVDNAVDFSPPDSRIEVRGNQVGKGAVVEIEDQGLGMTAEDREKFHAIFRDPPDFDVMALTEDSRLGFFVVARLARRHGVRVTLLESAYGGVLAAVLIPRSLLTSQETEAVEEDSELGTTWFGIVEPSADARGVLAGGTQWERVGASATARSEPPPTAGAGNFSSPSASTALEDTAPRRRQAEQGEDSAPRWPTAEPADDDRPPLPKRRRQSHLAPQLKEELPAVDVVYGFAEDDETDATQAQSMMTAFQRGTERGRADTDPWDTYRG